MIDFKEIFTASIVLLAVINIVGSIPIIISLREKVGHIESEKASIIAAIIMISFLFLGDEILKIIGVDINSFAVAGALIILFLALEMILGITIFKNEAPKTASIVPIAFPMIAGAGTMTSLLSLRAEFEVQQSRHREEIVRQQANQAVTDSQAQAKCPSHKGSVGERRGA